MANKAKIGKVMREFKKGALHSGSKSGPVVKNPAQAKAIAMSEAGMSKKYASGGYVDGGSVGPSGGGTSRGTGAAVRGKGFKGVY